MAPVAGPRSDRGARAQLGVVAVLLAAAGVAWWSMADRMAGMDAGPGTDLGALGWFIGVWVAMMAGMMLPSLAPTAAVYATLTRRRSTSPSASRLDSISLINVFTVPPEHQQRVVDLLIEATGSVMNTLPGYVSANIHRGLDGRHVANYAQWRSREAFEAMLQHPEAGTHMGEAAKLATVEPNLYEVVYSNAAS